MKTLKVTKPTKSKSISFSIDKDQYEKFHRLQSEAKDIGIRLTLKKIIKGGFMKKLIIIAVLFLPLLLISNAYAGGYTTNFEYGGTFTEIRNVPMEHGIFNLHDYNYRVFQTFAENKKNKYRVLFTIPRVWYFKEKRQEVLFVSIFCRKNHKWNSDSGFFENYGIRLSGNGIAMPLLRDNTSTGEQVVGGFCGGKQIIKLNAAFDKKANEIHIIENIPGKKELGIYAHTEFRYFIVHQGMKLIYVYAPGLYKAIPPQYLKKIK